ncbi:Ankyrin-1 [Chlorella vulgaris]
MTQNTGGQRALKRKLPQGFWQVVFSHGGQEHEVQPLVSAEEAGLVCDLLTLKEAIDGQLDSSFLRLRSQHLASLAVDPEHSDALRSALQSHGTSFSEFVEQLQDCTLLPETQRAAGGCLLVVAAERGHASIAQLLLAADPEAAQCTDQKSQTPLHCAAQSGHIATCQLLLDSAPQTATAADCDGALPLHSAAQNGQTAVVKLLLEKAPQTATAANSHGCLPLHLAAQGGHAAASEVLLDSAPQAAMSADENSKLPLHLACKGGDLATCQLLLDRAPQAVTAADAQGRLPLHWAAQEGHEDVCQLLLDKAPQAAMAADEDSWLPLHCAAHGGHTAIVQLLLGQEQQAATAADKDGCLPLHVAAWQGRTETCQLLLDQAPDTATLHNLDGKAPLQLALDPVEGPPFFDTARFLLTVGPTPAVFEALQSAGPVAQPLFADLVIARLPLPDEEWAAVPAPCPGLGRALAAVLSHSAEQARQLVRHLPPADVQQLRTAALSLHRAHKRLGIAPALPSPIGPPPPSRGSGSQPAASDSAPGPDGVTQPAVAPMAAGLAGLPPQHAAALQQAMQALASGQHPQLLQQVSSKMGIQPAQLQQTAAAIAAGSDDAIPPDVVQRAMQMQWAMRNGAAAPSNAAAAAAAAAGMPPNAADGAQQGSSAADAEALLLDGEEQQGCFDLYRRAYGRHLDYIFPPVYVAFASLVLSSGLLPFWVALFLVPACMVLGVQLVLVKGAGIPAPLVPFSRLPVALVGSLEVLAVATFVLQIQPWVTDWPWRSLAFAVLAVAFLVLHYRSCKLDPGFLEAKGQPQLLAPAQRAMCVAEFDHHCPVVGNCVGVGNRRAFMGYVLALWAAELLWLQLAGHFWSRVVGSQVLHSHALPGHLEVLSHFNSLARLYPGTLLTNVVVCFIFFGTSFLLARQALCVAGSLTTNELIMWHKYDYLQDQQRSLRNPFDDGPVSNCIQFWSEARPDWYALYVQRRQGRQPDAGQGEGQAGSSAASSPWRPPFLSVAALLRNWEQARSALHASRRAKQQRREQWMLQQYGGVTAAVAEQQGLIADGHAGCRSCEGHHHTGKQAGSNKSSMPFSWNVVFSHGGQEHEVQPLSLIEEAGLVCDLLALKEAIDEQLDSNTLQLRSQHLASLTARQLRDAQHTLRGSELGNISFDEVVGQVQACTTKADTCTPAHAAGSIGARFLLNSAALGHSSIAQFLLLADPHAVCSLSSKTGSSPLHCAAVNGHTDVVRLLLESKPSLAAGADARKWTALHLAAARGGRTAICQMLLDRAAELAKAANQEGALPLHLAAHSGCTATCQMLLDRAPATTTTADSMGALALHVAARQGRESTCKVLLAFAPETATVGDKRGWLALHWAAHRGHAAAAEVLVAAAPESTTRANSKSRTALQCALDPLGGKPHLAAARSLVAAGPVPDVLAALGAAGPAAQSLFGDFVTARLPMTSEEWAALPTPCPGIGGALPAVLAHSAEQTRQLLSHLSPADVQRLRLALLCLHRVHKQQHVYLPTSVVWKILGLLVI